MMTTMAALMATLPIALGLGAGGASRRSLGLAVVGGLIVSQCLTLYITPVIYLYLESAHQWYLRKRAKRAAIQTGNQSGGGVRRLFSTGPHLVRSPGRSTRKNSFPDRAK